MIVSWFNGWFQLLLCSSITAVPIDSHVLHLLMQIFSNMQKLLLINDFNYFHILDGVYEVGIDQVGERIFETSHPYERGKA